MKTTNTANTANLKITTVGLPVPDFTLPSHKGETVHLAAYQGRQNVLLFFMREFRCGSCTAYARQLVTHYPLITAQNAEVLILGLGGEELAQRLAQQINAPFPVLYDREGEVYDRFRLDRVLFSLIQRSAAFVIDQQGVIRYAHQEIIPAEWRRVGALGDTLTALNAKHESPSSKCRRWLFH